MRGSAKEVKFYISRRETDDPPVDIYETEDMLIFEVDLPGVDIDDISITSIGEDLIIEGVRKREDSSKEYRKYLCMERHTERFNRRISLPIKVDINNGKASYKNGVIRIKVPKIEKKAVKIEIER